MLEVNQRRGLTFLLMGIIDQVVEAIEMVEKWDSKRNISVAGHVRTFLRSVYEDPIFNWGKRFSRHNNAEQEATGWTAIMLGQRFDKY